MLCPSCHAETPPGAKTCPRCSASLPQVEDETATVVGFATPNPKVVDDTATVVGVVTPTARSIDDTATVVGVATPLPKAVDDTATVVGVATPVAGGASQAPAAGGATTGLTPPPASLSTEASEFARQSPVAPTALAIEPGQDFGPRYRIEKL